MKKNILFTVLVGLMTASASANAIKKSDNVRQLSVGTRIVVTTDLKVESRSSIDNLMRKETMSGFGRWCYVGINSDVTKVKAGTIFTLSEPVSIDEGRNSQARYISIETNEGLNISCLGNFIEGISVGKVESVLDHNIKFVQAE